MKSYLLAHDLGISGNKVILLSSQGDLLRSVTEPCDPCYFNNNWAEQEPADCPCWPGVIPPGCIVESAVLLVDLFPTIFEIAGVDPQFVGAYEFRGSSVVNLMTNLDDHSVCCAVIGYFGEGTTEPLRAIVGDGLKLVDV